MSIKGINFKFDDFEGMYTEFNNIIDILEDNVAEFKSIENDCNSLKGVSFGVFSENIVKCKDDNQKIIDEIKRIQIKFENIQDAANNHYKPINTNKFVKLDTEVLNKSIKKILSIISKEDLKSVIEETTTTTKWIVDRNNELDDSLFEALLNPIDEIRQRRAENVFNANEKLYKNAIENMREDMMFRDEIYELETKLKQIGKFDDLFSSIKEESLFDAYSMSVVGYNTKGFKDKNDLNYKTAETNSEINESGEKTEGLHLILDIIGLVPIPIVSQVSDLANALIYLLEGDVGNTALSLLAFIPIVGTASGLSKFSDELLSVFKKKGNALNYVNDYKAIELSENLIKSIEKHSGSDTVIDLVLKPLFNIFIGAMTGDFSSASMSIGGIGSSIFGMSISELTKLGDLDLIKILLK